MAIITSISTQQKRKNRCNVFIDGEYSFAVDIDTLVKFSLKIGQKIDDTLLANIRFECTKQEALKRAMDYLSRSIKTKSQVRTYLMRKEYSFEVISYVLNKLEEYKLIDDLQYAKQYIQASKKQGKRLTASKLMSRGVNKSVIEEADMEENLDYKSVAKQVAEKYLKHKEISKENLQKAYRYLIGRGFSYEEADFALQEFKEQC